MPDDNQSPLTNPITNPPPPPDKPVSPTDGSVDSPQTSPSPPPPPTQSDPPSQTGSPASAGEPAQIVEPIFKRFLPIAIGLLALIFIGFLVFKVIIPRFQKPPESETITLKYWGLWEPEDLVAQIINDYRADHPNVTIQYVRQSSKDYRERLQSSLAKGDGPDIFRWHNTWLPMLKNDLEPLPQTIYSPSEFDSLFYPIAKKDVFFNGSYYGLPLEFDALSLYVNQDMFVSQPDLKVPTTWDNLRQTAFKLRKLDAKGRLVTAGVALGTASNVDHFSDILGLMILQNGGDPGKPDDQAVTSALKFYTLFATQDKSWDASLPNSTYAFATEKVAMILAPSWRALEIKQINPQLNFKIYPAPQLPGTNVSWATYWIEGVSKKSANPQAAWEFIKYLSSQEVMTKMYSLASQNRLFGEPYSRQDLASSLQADPFVGAILTQAISAQSWPLASNTFDNGLNDRLIKYYEDAINSYQKQDDQKLITENLAQGVSQILSQYGLNTQ